MNAFKPVLSFIMEIPLTVWFFRQFEDFHVFRRRRLAGCCAFFLLLPLYLVSSGIPFGYFLRIPYRGLVYFLILSLITAEDTLTRLHISLSTTFLVTITQMFIGIARLFGIENAAARVFPIPAAGIVLALFDTVLLFAVFAGFLHFVPISRFRGISASLLASYLACTLGGIITRTIMLGSYNAGTGRTEPMIISLLLSGALYICIVMIERYYYLELDARQVREMILSSEYELKALRQKAENEEHIHSIYHDMKNHYMALDALLEQGKTGQAREYLHDLNTQAQWKRPETETGDPILDQLLSEKMHAAKEAGISVQAQVDYAACRFVSSVDTVIIFGNLLDNAIEAAARFDGKDRFISIRGGCSAGCFLGVISNSCRGDLRFVQGSPATTKKDTLQHGYGIKNVRKALAIYGGELNISVEKDVFSAYITIPLIGQEA